MKGKWQKVKGKTSDQKAKPPSSAVILNEVKDLLPCALRQRGDSIAEPVPMTIGDSE